MNGLTALNLNNEIVHMHNVLFKPVTITIKQTIIQAVTSLGHSLTNNAFAWS